MIDMTVPLIECINTWQGEGPDTGKSATLVRFKMCNLNCSFCDTAVKMRNSTVGNYTLKDIQKSLDHSRGLLITGGEPTLYNGYIITMLDELKFEYVNIETNGYLLKDLLEETRGNFDNKNKVKFICSPKFNSESDVHEFDTRILNDNRVYLKIVIDKNDKSIDNLNHIFLKTISKNKKLVGNGRLYLMPQGTTPKELKENSETVFDLAEEYKCNISSRLHLIYNFI